MDTALAFRPLRCLGGLNAIIMKKGVLQRQRHGMVYRDIDHPGWKMLLVGHGGQSCDRSVDGRPVSVTSAARPTPPSRVALSDSATAHLIGPRPALGVLVTVHTHSDPHHHHSSQPHLDPVTSPARLVTVQTCGSRENSHPNPEPRRLSSWLLQHLSLDIADSLPHPFTKWTTTTVPRAIEYVY
nr:hypothetical protein CFP56_01471 [Quercus suber]